MSFAPPFNNVCTKVSVTINEWGDKIMGSTTTLSCHFRQIDLLNKVIHQEESDADAMVWFPAGTNIGSGDSILFDSQYYQIEKITKARNIYSDEIQFIKCELKRTDLGLS